MVSIDIKEFRHGMWIEYNGHPNIVLGFSPPTPQKDLRFDGKWVVAINPPDYFNVPLEDIKPLKLTREMLEKAGFEQYEGFAEYQRTINIATGTLLIEYCLEDSSLFLCGGGDVINVEYFHELQNIIYDLSNDKEDISL